MQVARVRSLPTRTRAFVAALTGIAMLSGGCSRIQPTNPDPTEPSEDPTANVDGSIPNLRGRVVDTSSHQPVPGVSILDRIVGDAVVTRTNPDGTFEARVSPSASNDRITLVVRADGYCSIYRMWSLEELEKSLPLEIQLPKSSSIEGTIRDADGKPVANAFLLVGADLLASASGLDPVPLRKALGDWTLDRSTIQFLTQARTDSEGHFTVKGLLPWMPKFRVFSPQGQAALVEIEGGPLGGPGEVTHVDGTATVVQVGSIRGRLLLNGRPTAGNLDWKGPTREGSGSAKSDGSFRLDGVEAGPVTITTSWSTGERRDPWGHSGKSYSIELAAGATVDQEFDLVIPMRTVSGHVKNSKDEPIPKQRVYLSAPGEGRGGFQADAETGPDGAWSIEVPLSSSPCTIHVPDLPIPLHREGVVPGDAAVEFVVAEIAKGTLHIRVVDSDSGLPIAEPHVNWRRSGSPYADPMPVVGAEASARVDATQSRDGRFPWNYAVAGGGLKRDQEGGFLLECPSGSVDLFIGAGSLGYASVLRRDVDVGSPNDAKRIDVRLEKGIGITFRLSPDSGPQPEESLWIQVLDGDEYRAVFGSAQDERFTTRSQFMNVLEGLSDEREARLVPDQPYHMERLRKGHYRLAILEAEGKLEPDEIDARRDGETFVIRWTPK